jgi:hypothetical protein
MLMVKRFSASAFAHRRHRRRGNPNIYLDNYQK